MTKIKNFIKLMVEVIAEAKEHKARATSLHIGK
jgi:hypothetical protein